MKKTEVAAILRRAGDELEEWSVQGMGMLRRYLPVEDDVPGHTRRIHVWDSRLIVPGVSLMHTHPWDMVSEVFFGGLVNERYVYTDAGYEDEHWYYRQDLRPGEGGGLFAKPVKVNLRIDQEDTVVPGGIYTQTKNEIHVSCPQDGCVTIVDRVVPEGHNPDHAYTFWPAEDGPNGWVSAEPRPATLREVLKVIGDVL